MTVVVPSVSVYGNNSFNYKQFVTPILAFMGKNLNLFAHQSLLSLLYIPQDPLTVHAKWNDPVQIACLHMHMGVSLRYFFQVTLIVHRR